MNEPQTLQEFREWCGKVDDIQASLVEYLQRNELKIPRRFERIVMKLLGSHGAGSTKPLNNVIFIDDEQKGN